METRNSDAAHIKEGERHRQAIEETNAHIRGVALIQAKLCNGCRARTDADFDTLPRSRKRHIEFCLVNAPMNLAIFKKQGSYGSPTLEARFELLGAGLAGVTFALVPFLAKIGLLDETDQGRYRSFEAEFTAQVRAGYVEATHKQPQKK